ncbi:MAG: cysteine--tRNA ligase, partial [Acutalibacteraceae bacterium]
SGANKTELEKCLAAFDELCGVLGLVYNTKTESLDDEIEALIAERTKARAEKNWARADEIRDKLKAMNIILEDTPQGIKWHRA